VVDAWVWSIQSLALVWTYRQSPRNRPCTAAASPGDPSLRRLPSCADSCIVLVALTGGDSGACFRELAANDRQKVGLVLGLGEELVAALAIYLEFCYTMKAEQGVVLHLAQLLCVSWRIDSNAKRYLTAIRLLFASVRG